MHGEFRCVWMVVKMTVRIEKAAILKMMCASQGVVGLGVGDVFVDSLGVVVVEVGFSCGVPVTLSFLP